MKRTASAMRTSAAAAEEARLLRDMPSLPLLAMGSLGSQCIWSSEMVFGSPYLLHLGLSKSSMAFVFVAGPLSGLIVQPVIGEPNRASFIYFLIERRSYSQAHSMTPHPRRHFKRSKYASLGKTKTDASRRPGSKHPRHAPNRLRQISRQSYFQRRGHARGSHESTCDLCHFCH